MIDIDALRDVDAVAKPPNATKHWTAQAAMYEDEGVRWTQGLLEDLQVGIQDNEYPVQVSLLRRIIDRLASVYDRPPTRWLLGEDGERLPEDSPEHRIMSKLLGRPYNQAWRKVDRKRALHRNVVVRFYASDARQRVVLRTFDPFAVMRDVDPGEADTMDADRRFALNIGTMDAPMWEHWQRDGDVWLCHVVNDKGEIQSTPFDTTDGVCPYDRLPVQIVYDEWADGAAWLAPRSSRTTWTAALNATANDLWSMIVNQAHSQKWAEAKDSEDVPNEMGHTKVPVLLDGAKLHALEENPKLRETAEAVELFSRLWVGSEDLPTDEFQKGRQVVTGAALKVQEAPLMARREAQVEQAPEDEREAWERYRAVHNVHAKAWGKPHAPELELDVEIPDVNPPEDSVKLQERCARSLAMGTASLVDVTMEERRMTRPDAIQHLRRVHADNQEFPVPEGVAGIVSGPKPASTDHQSPSPTGSVTQAIKASREVDPTEPQGVPAE